MKPLFLLPFLFITVFFGSSVFAQGDNDVISVDSSIVVLNASVTDPSGRAVPGLNLKQFSVFEDGVDGPHGDWGIADLNQNTVTNNKVRGYEIPYFGVTDGKNKSIPGPNPIDH